MRVTIFTCHVCSIRASMQRALHVIPSLFLHIIQIIRGRFGSTSGHVLLYEHAESIKTSRRDF